MSNAFWGIATRPGRQNISTTFLVPISTSSSPTSHKIGNSGPVSPAVVTPIPAVRRFFGDDEDERIQSSLPSSAGAKPAVVPSAPQRAGRMTSTTVTSVNTAMASQGRDGNDQFAAISTAAGVSPGLESPFGVTAARGLGCSRSIGGNLDIKVDTTPQRRGGNEPRQETLWSSTSPSPTHRTSRSALKPLCIFPVADAVPAIESRGGSGNGKDDSTTAGIRLNLPVTSNSLSRKFRQRLQSVTTEEYPGGSADTGGKDGSDMRQAGSEAVSAAAGVMAARSPMAADSTEILNDSLNDNYHSAASSGSGWICTRKSMSMTESSLATAGQAAIASPLGFRLTKSLSPVGVTALPVGSNGELPRYPQRSPLVRGVPGAEVDDDPHRRFRSSITTTRREADGLRRRSAGNSPSPKIEPQFDSLASEARRHDLEEADATAVAVESRDARVDGISGGRKNEGNVSLPSRHNGRKKVHGVGSMQCKTRSDIGVSTEGDDEAYRLQNSETKVNRQVSTFRDDFIPPMPIRRHGGQPMHWNDKSGHAMSDRRPSFSVRENQEAPGMVAAHKQPWDSSLDRSSSAAFAMFLTTDSKPMTSDEHQDLHLPPSGYGMCGDDLSLTPMAPVFMRSSSGTEQTIPKLGACKEAAVDAWRGNPQHSPCQNGTHIKTSKVGTNEEVDDGSLQGALRIGVTATKMSKQALLIRRNDSILRSLFSGGRDGVGGGIGDDSTRSVPREFGLWKRAKKDPISLGKDTNEPGLPPSPLWDGTPTDSTAAKKSTVSSATTDLNVLFRRQHMAGGTGEDDVVFRKAPGRASVQSVPLALLFGSKEVSHRRLSPTFDAASRAVSPMPAALLRAVEQQPATSSAGENACNSLCTGEGDPQRSRRDLLGKTDSAGDPHPRPTRPLIAAAARSGNGYIVSGNYKDSVQGSDTLETHDVQQVDRPQSCSPSRSLCRSPPPSAPAAQTSTRHYALAPVHGASTPSGGVRARCSGLKISPPSIKAAGTGTRVKAWLEQGGSGVGFGAEDASDSSMGSHSSWGSSGGSLDNSSCLRRLQARATKSAGSYSLCGPWGSETSNSAFPMGVADTPSLERTAVKVRSTSVPESPDTLLPSTYRAFDPELDAAMDSRHEQGWVGERLCGNERVGGESDMPRTHSTVQKILAPASVASLPEAESESDHQSTEVTGEQLTQRPEPFVEGSRGSRCSAGSSSSLDDSESAAENGCHTCVSKHRPAISWRRGEQIGMGSFGKVFKGLNESTGELFAVKQIRLKNLNECTGELFAAKQIGLTDGPAEEIYALEAEIELMKNLNHRHIVSYCGTDRGSRHLYIFLEYVPGGSIASMLQQFGVFREDLVRRFVHQILLGVRYLHDKGIIHRDIKGANVLVTEQGIAKLADFGCSKQLQGVITQSFEDSVPTIRGSIPWMAPEMIKQVGHGRSADVWSVGATMIEMCTARYPWPPFSNNMAAMYHIATAIEPPKFPESVCSEAKNFLSRCLVIDPEKRMKAIELLQHSFIRGAAEELVATSGQGPGGLGLLRLTGEEKLKE